jgi:hypothetical protein
VVDLSPCMLNDEVANLHVKRKRLVVASCLDIEDVIMCGNNYYFFTPLVHHHLDIEDSSSLGSRV